jgi:serine/threonine protein kinase
MSQRWVPQQCSPQLERGILVSAIKSKSNWVPRLLCAFQCEEFLDIVMEFAEGGSLWDVIESSPFDGKVPVDDLKWWIPQCVSAISWCHANGFAHR